MDQTNNPNQPPAPSPAAPAPAPTPTPTPAPIPNMGQMGQVPGMSEPKSSVAGPIIGGIIVLAVVIFGALYFMNQRAEEQAFNEEVNAITTQSQSDDTAAIEVDLESTEIDNLDAELNAS
ncbi:MAG: hypothetical protein UW22_C0066G0010 [Candidatus Gottesmanbacteria bacterium GW2011_GWB1_44_11c]|uniref:Uncharacterized protein n=1 Tax=Candidatus Gottesmanbacteria bacterium GW2011_GWB1_44_11c TaxID=1618447 RepID=A0A0G1GJM1_9BACT|nr:MAG: hypothetical protein UW22_C0066G0010 [Candidatus Gottesmanbacteria bacterium GW2011_GWB1_44_11c]